jgi:hypothetical protein
MEAGSDNQLNISAAEARRPVAAGSSAEADAVIVSAFGRGNWLAQELCARGWRITLVDVSESLGKGEPEDAEGPFGLFSTPDLSPSFKKRLHDEGEMTDVPAGFALWLKDGPIECASQMTGFNLKARGISKSLESYLRHSGIPDKESGRLKRALSRDSFKQTWFANFAHQFTSNVFKESHRALDTGIAAPLFAPFAIRQVTAAGAIKAFKTVLSVGAKGFYRSAIQDLRFNEKVIDAIEISRLGGERSEIERSRAFIWMLSSNETQCFPEKVHSTLFPSGAVEPDWFWMRYRLEMTNQTHDNQLPIYTVAVEDPFLPWTHTNVVVLRKRGALAGSMQSVGQSVGQSYDAWIKLPVHARVNASELEVYGQKIESLFERRVPAMKPKIVGMQPGAGTTDPVRVPIFSEAKLAKLKTLKAGNVFFCGPEQWASLDWVGQYRKQNMILTRLDKLRAQWLAAEARELARNSKQ